MRKGDTLVAWKLDRIRRDLRRLVNLVQDLSKRVLGLCGLSGEGAAIDTPTPNGRLRFGFFAALAEFERELILERTKAGLASARAAAATADDRSRCRLPSFAPLRLRWVRGAPGSALCAELGVSRRTLYRHVTPQRELRPEGLSVLARRKRPIPATQERNCPCRSKA